MSWQEQLIHHVKNDQRRHSIVRESFPCFGEGEVEKALGVTHEGHLADARQRSFARGHPIVLVSHLRSIILQTNARCRYLRWRDPDRIVRSRARDGGCCRRLALSRRPGFVRRQSAVATAARETRG